MFVQNAGERWGIFALLGGMRVANKLLLCWPFGLIRKPPAAGLFFRYKPGVLEFALPPGGLAPAGREGEIIFSRYHGFRYASPAVIII